MRFTLASRLFAGLLCLGLLANCAVNPVTGRQNFVMMSESEEVRTGQKGDEEVRKEYGVYDNPTLQRYVNEVGQHLAQKSHRGNLEYHFTVVDSPEINAFALPGGYIYITRGIMAYLNSEAELAAVLGHEIGHVTARHSVQQYSASMAASIGVALGSVLVPELRGGAQDLLSLLGNALLSGYGRDHELEADRLGAEYLARAGYDPQAMVKVVGVLKNQELFDAEIARGEGREPRRYHGLFASHPDNDTRLKEVVGEANRFVQQTQSDSRQAAYLTQINGLVFGDSPSQGIVRDNRFLHDGLGFGLNFPPNWKIKNSPDKIIALSPENDVLIELVLAGPARGTPADFLRRNIRLDAGNELDTTPINGLPAAIMSGIRQGKPVKAGVIFFRDQAFVLVATAKNPAAYNHHRAAISSAIDSFHALQDSERKLAKPTLIHTRTAKKGETFASLARLSPLGKNAEGYLRLMNHAYPSGEPQAGQPLKTVE
ncbi:peptidase M48 Ste24p [Sulfuricella sp. T08]|uniref:M48 family metalloprotease n=1 Tax=Sulfuricella sp. T08 TaxID=1632857 RepID=UPI0006179FC2|nr:M48 family metalloprotease [Sulfuricella sp. T08]GAO34975.1 peptidase M48 Ste24p [Sulfuricella sp. T08]